MKEKNLVCELCGDGRLYTAQGLSGHMRLKHPEAGGPPSHKGASRFLDNEARFLSLLQEYGVTGAERVVSYTSSQAEDIYNDVPTGKIPAIIKHWAAMEGLPAPPKEIGATAATPLPLAQRFSLVADRIVPDPNGISYIQCLQELEVRLANQGKGNGEVSALREEVKGLREALINSQLAGVMSEVKSLKEQIAAGRTGRTEMDILHEIATKGMGEMSALRGDVKGYLQSHELPVTKTPEEREKRKVEVKDAVRLDREIEELGHRLFFPDTQPANST